MQPSQQPQAGCSSAIPLLLALLVLVVALAVLSMLTLGFVGVMLGIFGGLVAFVGVQYLVWGWWLSPLIARRQQAAELDDESAIDVPRFPPHE